MEDIAKDDLILYCGSDWREEYVLEDDAGAVIDLAGCTVEAQARESRSRDAALVVDFAAEIGAVVHPVSGESVQGVILSRSAAQTDALKARIGSSYPWDLVIVDAAGQRRPELAGTLRIRDTATKGA